MIVSEEKAKKELGKNRDQNWVLLDGTVTAVSRFDFTNLNGHTSKYLN